MSPRHLAHVYVRGSGAIRAAARAQLKARAEQEDEVRQLCYRLGIAAIDPSMRNPEHDPARNP